MPHKLRSASILLALHLIGGPLSGQIRPIPLDTVQVQVNSRVSGSLGAVTRSLEVIGAEEIRSLPALTVNDVLEWAFGVEMMPRSAALADVGIRGSSFEQVLVLVDGIRVRDAQTGHFNLNLAVPLEQIEQIEVLRGPAASLYGSDAMAGVINVRTRREGAATSARLSRGSFETTAAALSHRQRVGRVEADVAGSFQQSDGHRAGTDYEIATTRLGVAVPLGSESLHADIAHAIRDFGADRFYGPYPSYEEIRTTTASLRWRFAPDPAVSLEPRLSLRRNADDFLLDRAVPEGSRNSHTSHQYGGEMIGRVELEQVRIALGLHGYHDRIESTALGDQDEWTGALSFEAALGGPDVLVGSVGLRADRLVTGETVASPSFSAAWRASEALRLRSSVGRSFRAPTWTERHYPEVGGNVGNPDLRPEEAWSVDGGLDLYPAPALRLGVAVFLRSATNLIDWARPAGETETVWMTRNVESADFSGAEIEMELSDLAGFRIRSAGAWTSVSSSSDAGFESKYALRPQVDHLSLSVDRSFLDRFTLGIRGARERRIGEASYMRVDTRGSVQLAQVRLWFDVTNAVDEMYLDVVGNPAPTRSLMVGIEWRDTR